MTAAPTFDDLAEAQAHAAGLGHVVPSTTTRAEGLAPHGDGTSEYAACTACHVAVYRMSVGGRFARWVGIPHPCPPQVGRVAEHHVTWDPPATGAARRWTCDRPGCGAAVLDAAGNVYGSATTAPCPGAPS